LTFAVLKRPAGNELVPQGLMAESPQASD